jgi:hypothetical protein
MCAKSAPGTLPAFNSVSPRLFRSQAVARSSLPYQARSMSAASRRRGSGTHSERHRYEVEHSSYALRKVIRLLGS